MLNPNPNSNDKPNRHNDMYRKQFNPILPKQKTPPMAWCFAVICTLFWLVVILGGLAVLTVYLVYKPKNPRLDIASATLNSGYLDMGNLLNADLTLLINVVNHNQKVDMSFSYFELDLYYQDIMIGTQIVQAFYQPRGQSTIRNVQIITSQMELPLDAVQAWTNGTQPGGNGVMLQLNGKFQMRWLFGRWLRFTTRLHQGCKIRVGAPPNGGILGKECG